MIVGGIIAPLVPEAALCLGMMLFAIARRLVEYASR